MDADKGRLMPNSGTFFSVIVPSLNSNEHIGECLASVLANDSSIGFEVIVVDNGSTDGTVETAKSMGVAVIENNPGKRKTIAAQRNMGAALGTGRIYVFIDSDIVVPKDCLKKAKEFFDAGFSGALGFTYSVPGSAGWVAWAWGTRRYLKLNTIKNVSHLFGANIFINRDVFYEAGGFDESLVTNEDKDLTMRIRKAGHRVVSVPEDGLLHLGYEKDLVDFIRKEFWRQGSSLSAAKKHGLSFKSLKHPMLCAWHIFCAVLIFAACSFGANSIALILFAIWLLPSVLVTLTKVDFDIAPASFAPLYFFLTFLRWNVAGAALISQLVSGKRGDR